MINFAHLVDLSAIWGGLLALGVFLYVFLDGFDLGVGILFPFAPSDRCRDALMNSLSPFWDGNETWLVFSGGSLLSAFPGAYAILMPAFYLPLFMMLLGLVFRGVAFEFRFKTSAKYQWIWDYAFHFGSITASFCQGVILGTFCQGIPVDNKQFAGGSFNWLTPFALTVGVAVVCGYALLGATWAIMKTTELTQAWARRSASYVFFYVLFFMGLISLWAPFTHPEIYARWFADSNWCYLLPMPVLTGLVALALWRGIQKDESGPFMLCVALFLLNYLGLLISLWPYAVPFELRLSEVQAANTSLSMITIGAALALPVILSYTIYNYYLFRGKTSHESEH